MKLFLSLALILFGASDALAGRFETLHIHVLAMNSVSVPSVPDVKPDSDVCDNCNGVGKVGDGTIMKTCPECDGTGKKTDGGQFGGLTDGIIDRARDRAINEAGLDWKKIRAASAEVMALVEWSKAIRNAAPKSQQVAFAGDCPGGVCPLRTTAKAAKKATAIASAPVKGFVKAQPLRRAAGILGKAQPLRRAAGLFRRARPMQRAARIARAPFRLIRGGSCG